ncbi:MAG: GNAT family N-acetyltransferase [Acidimicrobiales bacterium]|nr:GNAT family N-acetyltransferase [Acidimicrobiales bacterium]
MPDSKRLQLTKCDVLAADGLPVHLRPLTWSDREAFLDLHRRLSPEARYRRFFSHQMPPDGLLERLLQPDQHTHVVLGAETDGELVAAATCSQKSPDRAEVAFAVLDEHQGRGLGTLLFEQFAASAAAIGITWLDAETLPFNRQMIEVFERAGYAVELTSDRDSTFASMRLDHAANPSIDERDALATIRSIDRVLAPKTVAVVGASGTGRSMGDAVLEHLGAAGFAGVVYAIGRDGGVHEVAAAGGEPAHSSVRDLPEPVDLAVLCVPSADLVEAVRECGDAGVGVVAILTELTEPDGEGRHAAEVVFRTARDHGMRVVGPSCTGIFNTDPAVRLHLSPVPGAPTRGSVSFACQSGAAGADVLDLAAELEIGVRSFVSLGDKLDVSGNDLLQYWEADPGTEVGVLYLESFGNPRKFARLARRFCTKKPLVVMYPDADAMSAGGELADALFRAAGIVKVDTLKQLFDEVQRLEQEPRPARPDGPGASNGAPVVPDGIDSARAKALLDRVLAAAPQGRRLDPDEFAELLDCYGLAAASIESTDGHPDGIPVAGAVHDEIFGPAVMLGGDGADRESGPVYALAPLTGEDAQDLLAQTGLGARIDGDRRATRDGQVFADLLVRLSHLIDQQDRVAEIEIERAAITPSGVEIGDGGAVIRPADTTPPYLRRRMRGSRAAIDRSRPTANPPSEHSDDVQPKAEPQ